LFDSLDRNGRKPGDVISNERLPELSKLYESARNVVGDVQADEGRRLAALRLLARERDKLRKDISLLSGGLSPRNSTTFQTAVAAKLATIRLDEVAQLLLAGWKAHSPALRTQILDIVLSRDAWVQELLAFVERNEISISEFDAARRQRLLQHKDA